ncbi:MAG: hypothetical protein ABIV23_06450 [Sphingomicrobium sp.]
MIPMRHSTIFRNRWWALLWAAGILWFALDVAGGGDGVAANSTNEVATDASGAPVSTEQAEQLERAINSI